MFPNVGILFCTMYIRRSARLDQSSSLGYCEISFLATLMARALESSAFFCLIVGLVDHDQRRITPRRLVERLGGLGRLGMLVGVLQIDLGFLLRTLGLRLPFATEFVVDQVIGGQIGPLGARKFLDHLLHVLFVDRDAQCRIAHFGRGTGGLVCRLDLPADVGAAIKRFAGQRGSWEIFGDARVDSHRVLRSSTTAAAPAGFHLGIESLAEQDLVAIGSSGRDDSLVHNPAGNIAVVLLLVAELDAGDHVHRAHDVDPARCALDDGNLTATADVRQLCRGGVGRNVDDALAQHDAAFGGEQRRREKHHEHLERNTNTVNVCEAPYYS